ncbi:MULTISPECIES: beta-galactosidase family protein [unclassified Microbacterium]|uniref:glycoside hydrolase family 35 protein n=1 Tax=unclassified Microbacterium TaxID=2609290 RepID=UPI000EA8FC13|nr:MULTISPECIES: beta-galactosidase family protein [unclassified Microbacterium]MBT2485220.1 beta-galactosidase [Microbacterium sp. ISL-108]RKN68044.1 beta-galactosidase [Microbacterium sp. CGR2]
MTSFSIGATDFLRDGHPHQVISGAIHYFRVHPDQWQDRIHKARLMGLNTIETYVAWNAHEPRRGEWDATGWNDLGRFLDLVHEEGLDAIVRPGPYICAEWHNGGLPTWLTGGERRLRASDPAFLADVGDYLRRVYEIVEPRQIDRGGPVVLVQIENEYGAYGADKAYLEELVAATRDAGITVPLTTVDQPVDQMLEDGSLPGLHKTASFGSRSAERLATLRHHQPTGPLMCSEFWDGWFDWWGGVHHTTDVAAAASDLDALLAAGASVNIYMFHGGTNFGLTNGANDKGRYLPLVTSYDYDAPLDEAGNPTEKYFAFREVIARHASVPEELPSAAAVAPTFEIATTAVGPWTDAASPAPASDHPHTFDQLAHLGPLVRYDVELPDGVGGLLALDDVRDLAWVSVDGQPVGTLSRTRHDRTLRVPAGGTLSILVEDQGRVNYGHRLGEEKGLIGSVTLDGVPLSAWRSAPLDVVAAAAAAAARFDDDVLRAQDSTIAGPLAWVADFPLDGATDLFLDTAEWGKGYAFINGFLLGRYWRNGPQRSLYVPAPVTRAGGNRLVVLELENLVAPRAAFLSEAVLGDTEE